MKYLNAYSFHIVPENSFFQFEQCFGKLGTVNFKPNKKEFTRSPQSQCDPGSAGKARMPVRCTSRRWSS